MLIKFIHALVFNFFLIAVAYANDPLPLIQVSAEGISTSAPDQARVQLSFAHSDINVKNAREIVDNNVRLFLVQLKGFELESQTLDSSQINIYPEYDHVNGKRNLRSYQVKRGVKFNLNQLDQLEKLIEVISSASVATLNNIEFSLSDKTILKEEALTKALEHAKHLAQHIASTYEVKLGKVHSIKHQPSFSGPRMMRSMAMESLETNSSASTYQQEKLEYKATIDVAFSFH